MRRHLIAIVVGALVAVVLAACGSSGTKNTAKPPAAKNSAPQAVPADASLGTPLVGEVRMFGGTFAPAGWHLADGSMLPISANNQLFSVIGTTFGGDGHTNFAVPNITSPFPNIIYVIALKGTMPVQGSGSSQHFAGEIGMFAGSIVPAGWHAADGSVVPISDSPVLFNTIGTTFGGDGNTTMGLPKIQSPFPNIQFLVSENGADPKGDITEPNAYIIGQLGMFAGPFFAQLTPAPLTGWVLAKGEVLSIPQNQALFSLYGTTFGGDGVNNFWLPRITSPFPNINFLVALQGIFPAHS
jgi:microcystin-dependent protein/predicted small lipoprotein YifL